MAATGDQQQQGADRVQGFPKENVWGEFTSLAREHNSVNMGQGFPNFPPPAFVVEAGVAALRADHHQYARSMGSLNLVGELAKYYSGSLGREVNPLSEVMVGVGATEVLFATFQGHVQAGDEVLLFAPSFDIYLQQVRFAGGTVKCVPLTVREGEGAGAGAATERWGYEVADVIAALSPRTRILLLNNPHNPTGKVFSKEEVEELAVALRLFPRVILVCDEVYEHLVFGERRHLSAAALPELWERTITVSSSGKTFSATGWKVGWAVGPASLIHPIWLVHQYVCFSVCTPMQEAVAEMLARAQRPYEGHPTYFAWLKHTYQARRDLLAAGLEAVSLRPVLPEAGYFVMANTENVTVPEKYASVAGHSRDWALCRWFSIDLGVTPIPPSAFYPPDLKPLGANYARFAFCKRESDIEECCRRLKDRLPSPQ